MPYIKQSMRNELDPLINALAEEMHELGCNEGDLNYCITSLVIAYVEANGLSYSSLSDVTGVLNDVKVEFERRVVAPYEDKKIAENGDVYPDPRRGIK